MDSRKFWYFARRWFIVAITTGFFAFMGFTGHNPTWAGALLVGVIGFITSFVFCFAMTTDDYGRRGEPWER